MRSLHPSCREAGLDSICGSLISERNLDFDLERGLGKLSTFSNELTAAFCGDTALRDLFPEGGRGSSVFVDLRHSAGGRGNGRADGGLCVGRRLVAFCHILLVGRDCYICDVSSWGGQDVVDAVPGRVSRSIVDADVDLVCLRAILTEANNVCSRVDVPSQEVVALFH